MAALRFYRQVPGHPTEYVTAGFFWREHRELDSLMWWRRLFG